jgi:hypothetical protein
MTTTSTRKRSNYFADEVGEEEFHRSSVKLLAQVQKQTTSRYLLPENTHRLKHGGQWIHPAAPESPVSDIKKHSSNTTVPFEKIINHDLTVIDQVVGRLAEDMERQFAQSMYSTVSAAAEMAGNTVDAKSVGSLSEAFAQLLEKVQFSADKFGKVSLPEIHLAPETAKKLKKAFDKAPPEFHQRIEEIKARKTEAALQGEIQRKSRFVCYGGGK